MAVGAYASGLATIEWGLPFWLISSLRACSRRAVSVPFGLPSRRLKGPYFAIATLAAHQITSRRGALRRVLLP